MSDTPLRVAVDFDGVIHDPNDILPGYKLGQPIKDANMAMNELKKQGAIIVIHSVWANTDQKREAMSKWCRHFDIPYDFITNEKPMADFYIDDKAVRFENWRDTLEFVRTHS